jgi:hypothetical protein
MTDNCDTTGFLALLNRLETLAGRNAEGPSPTHASDLKEYVRVQRAFNELFLPILARALRIQAIQAVRPCTRGDGSLHVHHANGTLWRDQTQRAYIELASECAHGHDLRLHNGLRRAKIAQHDFTPQEAAQQIQDAIAKIPTYYYHIEHENDRFVVFELAKAMQDDDSVALLGDAISVSPQRPDFADTLEATD